MSNVLHVRPRRSPPSEIPVAARDNPRRRNHPKTKKAFHRNLGRSCKRLVFLCGGLVLLVEFMFLQVNFQFNDPNDAVRATSRPHLRITLPPVEHPPRGDPDGSFGGYPVYYRKLSSDDAKLYTMLNCLGENWRDDNWKHRSCHFKLLCFNVTSRDFQVYPRRGDTSLQKHQTNLMDLSESLLTNNTFLSLGGINLERGEEEIQRFKWFPRIMATPPPTEFYALPPQVVLVPFRSFGGWNPRNLMWDDFLPIWTLLDIFQLHHHEILALQYVLVGEGLGTSCGGATSNQKECRILLEKFWPLLNNQTLPVNQKNVELSLKTDSGRPKTDLVCAKNGASGIADLTDHGFHQLGGRHDEDYQTTHNHGRGERLWKFRLFCLGNLGIRNNDSPSAVLSSRPFRIVISIEASNNPMQTVDFTQQHRYLAQELSVEKDVEIKTVVLKDMSLRDQIQTATETNIFITSCDGSAVTAMFLPRDATAILFYNEEGEKDKQAISSRLDWDLFNHLSYIRTLWFPSKTMDEKNDLITLSEVVKGALNRQRLEFEQSSNEN